MAIARPADLADQYDLSPFDPAFEVSSLQAERFGLDDTLLEVRVVPAPVTLDRLEETLRQGGVHILHLVAHVTFNARTGQSFLLLANSQ